MRVPTLRASARPVLKLSEQDGLAGSRFERVGRVSRIVCRSVIDDEYLDQQGEDISGTIDRMTQPSMKAAHCEVRTEIWGAGPWQTRHCHDGPNRLAGTQSRLLLPASLQITGASCRHIFA